MSKTCRFDDHGGSTPTRIRSDRLCAPPTLPALCRQRRRRAAPPSRPGPGSIERTVRYGDLVGTWTDGGGPTPPDGQGLARVVLPRVERQSVAECIFLNAWRQIRKFHLTSRRVIADEPALLENVSRGPVFRMAERKQSGHTGPTGHLDDGRQSLRGIALSPGVCR